MLSRTTTGRRLVAVLSVSAFLSVPFLPASLAPAADAAGERMLCDFETPASLAVIEGRTKIQLVAEHATQGTKAGKVPAGFTLVAGSWTHLPADWSGYDELRLDVFNPGGDAKVSLWISDGKSDYWERHNAGFTLRQGANMLVIPTGGLYRGEKGSGKFLDARNIQQLVVTFPKEGDGLFLDNFRLVKGAGAVQSALLLGFEDGEKPAAKWSVEDWPEDKPGRSRAAIVAEHATQGGKALKLEYRTEGAALVLSGVPRDWSGYDTLEIDCFSAAEGPVQIGGWVRDEASKDGDYWQRHNWQMTLRPGATTIQLPVGGLYRGEKGSGKFLDTTKIDSLCITAKGVTVYFDNIRLVKGAEEVAVAGLRKFDFGPRGSPNFPGFTPVLPDTGYTPQRGYGWLGSGTRDGRNYEQPDSLVCDFIRVDGGTKFVVDAPDGEYVVHVLLDVPGFWDYPAFNTRAILAGGKEVFRQTVTNQEFLKDWYFRYQDAEDLPGVDVWPRYVGDRFKAKTFRAQAAGGKLELTFVGDTWGLTVAWLAMYPAASAEAGQRWIEQLDRRRKSAFTAAYAEVIRPADPKPQVSAEEQQAGFVLFARGLDREVSYNSAPGADPSDTRQPQWNAAACPGEYESFSFSVWPLKDCGELKLTVSDLTPAAPAAGGADGKKIPASAIRQRAVRYKFKRIGGRITSSYRYEPWLLADFQSWPLPAGVTRQFWLTLHAPPEAAPGKYTGTITVSLAGTTRQVPVSLEVFPFALDEPKMPVGMYGGAHPTGPAPSTPELLKEFGWDRRVEEVLRDQKEHGMTAVTPVAPNLVGFKDGKAVFDYRRADECMALLGKIGFHHECFTYANMFRVGEEDAAKACQARYGLPLEQAIKLAYEELGRHMNEANWLPMAWALADEPLIHGVPAETVIQVFTAHRKAAPQMQFVMEDAMGDPSHYAVIPAIDVISGNSPRYQVAEAVRKNKSRYWFNNIATDRLTFGWFLWKAHRDMGVEALFQWGYSTNTGDIYYDLDGSEGDSGVAFTASEGQRARPCWELIREGMNDHRYLQTLDNLIRKAEAAGGAGAAKAAQAKAFCQDACAKIDLEQKGRGAYTQAELDTLKRRLAGFIIELQKQ